MAGYWLYSPILRFDQSLEMVLHLPPLTPGTTLCKVRVRGVRGGKLSVVVPELIHAPPT